jgi:1,4-dihydroxy-2-naphthoate octaprenyltransferase
MRTLAAMARMVRPEQIALILVVFATGLGSAQARGSAATAGAIAVAVVSLAIVSASVHITNELADYETDKLTVRTAFSGGSGAASDYELTRTDVARIAGVTAACAVGAVIVAAVVLPAVASVLLVVGLIGGWWYSLGPWALSRHGLGEVANAVLGGIVLPLFGVAVAAGEVVPSDVVLFVPFALLAFVNLLETQWPDRDADRQVGKLTLVTRLSLNRTRALAFSATIAAYGLLVVVTPEPMPIRVALATLVALPLSLYAIVRLGRAKPLAGVAAMVVCIIAQGTAWWSLAAQ